HFSIATRSGTNRLLADGYAFFRDDAWNGANALTGTSLPMHQNQFGASAGGPITRDRTFFFVNVEQRRLEQSGLTTVSEANTAGIKSKVPGAGCPTPPGATRTLRA